MHTIGATNAIFEIAIDDRPGALAELMPDFDDDDRLGVVVRSPLGGLGASALVFAMVIDFYATHRDAVAALRPGELLYPQHFVFHVGTASGDYSWLDFWPPHKEVVVAGTPTAIARALSDHGITRLLVEETDSDLEIGIDSDPDADLAAALEQQIVTWIAFSADGRAADADVRIVSNPTVERWVAMTIDPEAVSDPARPPTARSLDRLRRAAEVTDVQRAHARSARAQLLVDGSPVETYRRLAAREGLALLGATMMG